MLVQSVTDYAIYMLSPEGIITNWNSGAERIKGYTPEEIIGQHFSHVLQPEEDRRPASRKWAWTRPRGKAGSKRKAGAFARTARDSGPTSSSTPSTTTTAS